MPARHGLAPARPARPGSVRGLAASLPVGLLVGLLVVPLAGVVLVVPGVLAPAPAVAAETSTRSGGELSQAQRCARPALAPGLRVRATPTHLAGRTVAQSRVLATVVARGRAQGLPARAQAIAVTVWLGAHDGALPAYRIGAHPARLSVAAIYRRLQSVAGWRVRPPAIVGHQVLGTPDPYVLTRAWGQAVSVLAQLSGRSAITVGAQVATGARARRGCTPTAAARRGFPLPAGTGYAVSTPSTRTGSSGGATGGAAGGATGSAAAVDSTATQIEAPCGTPVLAASAGTVQLVRDVSGAGPWLIRVTGPSGTTTYAHVGHPVVRDGATVLVGAPLASVADYAIDRCALGFGVAQQGKALAPTQAVTWLAGSVTPPAPLPPATTTFRMATQNVLGAHLTGGRGTEKPSYAPGSVRMREGLGLIESSGASVVAFQEFETPAAEVVTADGEWGLFRATPNNVFRDGNTNGDAIAWRLDTWDEVSETEFTVPWEVTLHMPVVTLRNKQTGAEVIVIGVHNPASTPRQGDQSRARGVAVAIERTQVSQLEEQTGLPIVLAGDTNDHTGVVCSFAEIGLRPHLERHTCGAYGGVDDIFGTGPIEMADLVVNRATLGRISDHPLVTSEIVLNP